MHAVFETGWRQPADVLAAFADEPWAVGLISGGDPLRARWSYVARRPDLTLVVPPQDARDPLEALRDMIGDPAPVLVDGPPFQGELIGLASYEFSDRLEPIGLRRRAAWADFACARYPAVLAFDHLNRRVLALGRCPDREGASLAAANALAWLDEIAPLVAGGALASSPIADSPATYEAAVAQVVGRIAAGEIFQANIARAWTGRLAKTARPFDLAARLVRRGPAPFAAYLRLDDQAVVSNSPERFVELAHHRGALRIRTQPIKGTRPRGRNVREDAALAAELAGSLKDRAENLMIVDLMRNDLARVCTPGAVRAPKLFDVETFANVHHLVSTVTGELASGRDAVDVLRATFPPGSITGAPKLQAMKVIAGLEPPRGPFFGSMFWIGGDGAMDSNVLIRTTLFERDSGGWRFETRAGAGIVADSDPFAERRETEAKISTILHALTEPG